PTTTAGRQDRYSREAHSRLRRPGPLHRADRLSRDRLLEIDAIAGQAPRARRADGWRGHEAHFFAHDDETHFVLDRIRLLRRWIEAPWPGGLATLARRVRRRAHSRDVPARRAGLEPAVWHQGSRAER